MFLETGSMSVINRLKSFVDRLASRFEGNLACSGEEIDFHQLERTRRKLAEMRFRKKTTEMTGSFDLDCVRRRIAEADEAATIRERHRQSINKWRRPGEIIDSGCFDVSDLNVRMAQNARREEEELLEPLPPVEDTMMAFSKPEHNYFEEEKCSFASINCRLDPFEILEEEFSIPALLPFRSAEISQIESTLQDEKFQVLEQSHDPQSETICATSNPMARVLSELEERMSANRERGLFWVESGDD